MASPPSQGSTGMIPLTGCTVSAEKNCKMADSLEPTKEKANGEASAGKLTHLPVARIKTIMKSSPDLPQCSQESVFLITKATELFIDFLSTSAHKEESDSKHLTYKGLSKVVEDNESLQFLADIVPPKVLVKDYWESLKKKSRKSSVEANSSGSESESE